MDLGTALGGIATINSKINILSLFAVFKMYISDLSNDQISAKMKDFCFRTISTVENDKRTSTDLFNMILEVDDWIKAFFRLYKESKSPSIMKVIDHLELMKACSENIGDGQRTDKAKKDAMLQEMKQLSLKLLDIIDGKDEKPIKSNIQNNADNISENQISTDGIKQAALDVASTTSIVEGVLESEGIDSIKINKIG